METKEPVIEIKGLKKQYRLGQYNRGRFLNSIKSKLTGKKVELVQEEFFALNDINLTIYKGDIVGIIGANGAGKSTLLKIVSRITLPSEGEIRIKGTIASMLEVGTGFNPEMTGRENVYMNGAILGMSEDEITQCMDDIIDFSECAQFIDTPVKRYSSGMYVRLAFAVSAFLKGDILVMDEVLAVGDAKFQQKCLGKMESASASENRTVLFVSHNINSIRQLCTRCVVLDKGRVVYDGSVDEGILIYAKRNDVDQSEADLCDFTRPPALMQRAQLQYAKIIRAVECATVMENHLLVYLKWHSYVNDSGLVIRVIIREMTKEPVGMSCTTPCFNLKQDQDYEQILELDLSLLVPGRYLLDFVIGKMDGGSVDNFDCVTAALAFDRFSAQNEGSFWARKTWGAIHFSDMIVHDVANSKSHGDIRG